MSEKREKQRFDPDYSHRNPVNQQAAKDHGLRFDSKKRVYADEDGCPVRDKFGQPL